HDQPLDLRQAAVGDIRQLKNRPLTGGILTPIALRAIWLFAGFDDVTALTGRAGHFDHGHRSPPPPPLGPQRRSYTINTKMEHHRFTCIPVRTFSTPSAITRSPGFSPSAIIHMVPTCSPTLTVRMSTLLSHIS